MYFQSTFGNTNKKKCEKKKQNKSKAVRNIDKKRKKKILKLANDTLILDGRTESLL